MDSATGKVTQGNFGRGVTPDVSDVYPCNSLKIQPIIFKLRLRIPTDLDFCLPAYEDNMLYTFYFQGAGVSLIRG